MTKSKKIIFTIILLLPSYFLIKILIDNFYWQCPIFKYTGLYCPGCGMTRAFRFLLVGNVKEAIKYNFLAPIITIFLAYILLKIYCIKILELKIKFDIKKIEFLSVALLVTSIVFCVLRNILNVNLP